MTDPEKTPDTLDDAQLDDVAGGGKIATPSPLDDKGAGKTGTPSGKGPDGIVWAEIDYS